MDTTYATLCGTVLAGVVQGLLGGFMFWWLGLNAPVFRGLVMGILWIIPLVGLSLVWAPAAILLALGGHWGKAVVLVAWGSLVIGLTGNLLYPIVLGRRLRLHTVAVFVAMVGGMFLYGACGFFLGPITLAATLVLAGVWKQRAHVAAARCEANSATLEHETDPHAPRQNADDRVGRMPMDLRSSVTH